MVFSLSLLFMLTRLVLAAERESFSVSAGEERESGVVRNERAISSLVLCRQRHRRRRLSFGVVFGVLKKRETATGIERRQHDFFFF